MVKIYKGHFDNQVNSDLKPGTISFEKNQIQIPHSEGNYIIEELQPQGKKRMSARDFINGLKEKTGWNLG